MPKVRLAAALLVPPHISQEIDGLRRALGDAALERIAPHITLIPPVNVPPDQLDVSLKLLRDAAAQVNTIQVRIGPVTTFLPHSPVIYLDVDDSGRAISELRDQMFHPPLYRDQGRPFVPHITLSRESSPERIKAAMVALHDFHARIVFDRVHLLQESAGRVWRPIADAALGPRAVVGQGGLPLELTVCESLDPEAEIFADREFSLYDESQGMRWEATRKFAIVARREGRIAGTAKGKFLGSTAHLSELIVGQACRGQGVGSHLLAKFESFAAENGCDRLTVHAVEASRAERFYKSKGWMDDIRLPNWCFGVDQVRLQRRITRTQQPQIPVTSPDDDEHQ